MQPVPVRPDKRNPHRHRATPTRASRFARFPGNRVVGVADSRDFPENAASNPSRASLRRCIVVRRRISRRQRDVRAWSPTPPPAATPATPTRRASPHPPPPRRHPPPHRRARRPRAATPAHTTRSASARPPPLAATRARDACGARSALFLGNRGVARAGSDDFPEIARILGPAAEGAAEAQEVVWLLIGWPPPWRRRVWRSRGANCRSCCAARDRGRAGLRRRRRGRR